MCGPGPTPRTLLLLTSLGGIGDAMHVQCVARARGCGGVCTRALWIRVVCDATRVQQCVALVL